MVINGKEIEMEKAIYFDMDGTLADFYGVEGWLTELQAERVTPYGAAKPLLRMNALARRLNHLQKSGYKIGIVSWLAKNSSEKYNEEVAAIKKKWLRTHLASVKFDEIIIVKYGTPKEEVVKFPKGILFDDEERNRNNWKGKAYSEKEIIEVLKTVA